MSLSALRKQLHHHASKEHAAVALRFFKTGPGEYGAGDKFIGVRVPHLRRAARDHRDLPLSSVDKLLISPIHEERLTALFILVLQFSRGDDAARNRIYKLYRKRARYVNNWDLVDSSASYIVGPYLQDRPRGVLDQLARSRNLWERRIAIIATLHFIKQRQFADTIRLARVLRDDDHDLIHKAVGWMLREVGNRDKSRLEKFLNTHCRRMPRTMLRYAIEKFPERERKRYLKGAV